MQYCGQNDFRRGGEHRRELIRARGGQKPGSEHRRGLGRARTTRQKCIFLQDSGHSPLYYDFHHILML